MAGTGGKSCAAGSSRNEPEKRDERIFRTLNGKSRIEQFLFVQSGSFRLYPVNPLLPLSCRTIR
jgi:hypothetical protein